MDEKGWLDIAYCVDDETEILTSQGFRRYDELDENDCVLTLNHEEGQAEWQPLLAVNVFDPKPRRMILMDGRSHSSLTTPNHRWPVVRYVRRYRSKVVEPRSRGRQYALIAAEHVRRFATSETLGYFDRIPVAAACAHLPSARTFEDDYVELMAWFWTEGYVRLSRGKPTTGVTLFQSHVANPHLVARIRRCLLDLVGPPETELSKQGDVVPRWRERRNGHKTEFVLNNVLGRRLLGDAPDKVVSGAFISSLTEQQLSLFVQTSIDGDGWRHPLGCAQIAQKDPRRLGPLQMACSLLGIRTTLSPPPMRWPGNGPTLTIAKRNEGFGFIAPRPAASSRHRFVRQHVLYDGAVWCPSTVNGTWFARRRGTTYFTGNSFLFCQHGHVFEGRGFGVRSAANGTAEANDHYVAFCFLGSDANRRDDLTPSGRRALTDLIAEFRRRYPRARELRPHSHFFATLCPGDELRAFIRTQLAKDRKEPR
jgi:hypothetical protein